MRAVVIVVATLLAGSAALHGASNPLPVGPQFQVNSYTTGGQAYPAIAADAAGNFVVIWDSSNSGGGDTSGSSIQGQRYAAGGTPAGSQFQVNGYTSGNQEAPEIAADPGGNFVVVWGSYGSSGGDTASYSVQGQRYAANGTPAGSQFQVNGYTTGVQSVPTITADAAGNFAVAWHSQGSSGSDTSSYSIQGRLYAGSGAPSGSQFQVNAYTTGTETLPAIAAAADGDFVVVWHGFGSSGSDTASYSIQGQRYAANGSPSGSPFQVNSYTTGSQSYPAIAADPAGNFVVVWESTGSSGSDSASNSVQGQRYTAGGSPSGSEFQVNGYTTNSQRLAAIAADADGDFVVVWQSSGSSGSDTGGYSVQGQRYAANGTPAGSQFQVNGYTTSNQFRPTIAAAPDGDFVVAWSSQGSVGGDTSSYSIQGQRFRVTGDLQGKVFFDQDFDGIQDGAEPGVAGVAVELYDDTLALRRTAVTNASGNYFLKPKEGSWHLRFIAPFEHSFTLLDAGTDDTLDSDAQPSTGETEPFTVAVNVLDSTRDAGLTNGIGDKVWNDLDRDGIREGGELGLAGVTLRLRNKAGSEIAVTTTDAAGRYHFNSMPPAEYYVDFTPPAGFAFSPANAGGDDAADSDADEVTGNTPIFTFTQAEIDTSIDAGMYQLSSIGGRAWDDLDRDGVRTGGEPGIDGLLVRLLDATGATVLASQGTTGGGFYAFENLASATYRVEIVPLGGIDLSPQDVGGDDTVDSDFDPATARTAPIVFTAGSVAGNVDAGLQVVVLLLDGFESGDLSRWSVVAP